MESTRKSDSAEKLRVLVLAAAAPPEQLICTVTSLEPLADEIVIINSQVDSEHLNNCRKIDLAQDSPRTIWNKAIAENEADWLLLIHAGETMASEDYPRCAHLLKHPIKPAYELIATRGSDKEYQLRLLPPFSGIRFDEERATLALSGNTALRCRPFICNVAIHADACSSDSWPIFSADELAVEIARREVERRPDDWQPLETLANALLARRRFQEALPILRRAIRLHPRYAPFYSALGYALMEMGLLSDAHDVLNRAIAMMPDYPQLWLNLGVVWLRIGNIKKAVPAFSHALALKPDDALTHFNLAICLMKLGRMRDAQKHLEQTLYHNPGNIQAQVALSLVLLDTGRAADAKDRLEAVLQQDPENCAALYHLGFLYRNTGERSKAIKLWRTLISLHPDSKEATTLLRDVTELRIEHKNVATSSESACE
jgi:tetratricopeptide (TPR) repeat protein